ncbi:MAG: cadmium-translocating P-type ATPase [Ruminococcaceae bacterium]|nr:cadmium-translocating P-type ATPase [Oscillospiraceae bacterium]
MEHHHEHCHCHEHEHGHCDCHEHEHKHEHCCCGHDHDHHHHEEGGCACCEAKLSGEQKLDKWILPRIGFSAALFILGFFLPGPLRAVCFSIAYGVIAWDVLWAAVKNIRKGHIFDEQFLMSIASIGAFCIGEYPEAVAVMLFYQVGETFQTIAVGKSRESIKSLMELRPDSAVVLRDGEEYEVSPEDVAIGEMIVVRPGARIPLDGTVLHGISTIDNSALTGESEPVYAEEGTRVFSGGVNLSGVLHIRAESLYRQSTVAKILELVEHATEKKAKSERFITRFSRWYTPCVVIGAVLLAIVSSLLSGDFGAGIHRALVFLVVSCPCALVVSVPLSFVGGIGGAARRGVLIKGSDALEALASVNTVVFDKTGTLTKGVFQPAEVCPVSVSREELQTVAAALEKGSNHPIARCLAALGEKTAEDVQELAGGGISGYVEGKLCYAGNRRFLEGLGITIPHNYITGTAVHIAREGEYLGYITVRDEIRPEAKEVVFTLKTERIETMMLTGDRKDLADRVGQTIGIEEICAQLLPQDKVTALEEKIKAGRRVAVVGDGMNDAPVLARGHVGIAMGGIGSDAAIESADVVLMEDKLGKIPEAITLAKKTMNIVRQNILFSLGAKLAIMGLSVWGLKNMLWIAVFGDVGVMIIATVNALRTYLWKK